MTRGKRPVKVEALNWIVAMGQGLERLGFTAAIERLACEMLPNGTIIARDVQSGTGFVIKPEAAAGRQVAAEAAKAAERGEESEDSVLISRPADSLEGVTVESGSLSNVVALNQLPDLTDLSAEDVSEQVQAMAGELEAVTDAETALIAWERALEIGQRITGAEACAAVQLTSNNMLIFVAVRGGLGERLKAARLPQRTGFVGFCVDRVVGFIVEDAARDPRHYTRMDRELDFVTRDALVVPVTYESTLFGCVELLNAAQPAGFRGEHLEAMEVVAYTLGERLYRAGLRGRRL
ncbi:MAG: GAF domain-containing protein [Alphaproteobacteria bacterium]|nr:GAF domain-containing protein [Alphaproteobacteria bacterium]